METPRNTMLRDRDGNIREGVRWYIEFNDILTEFFGNECGYSRGFQRIVIGKHSCLGSVFELDTEKEPTKDFFDFIKSYRSEYIKGLVYQKEIKDGERVIYRNAIIALL